MSDLTVSSNFALLSAQTLRLTQPSVSLVQFAQLGLTPSGGTSGTTGGRVVLDTITLSQEAQIAANGSTSAFDRRTDSVTSLPNSIASLSFVDQDLQGVFFVGQDLSGARFVNSNLSGANFTGTNLSGAVFEASLVSGATFNQSTLDGTDLRGAQGLTARQLANVQLIGTLLPTGIGNPILGINNEFGSAG